LDDLEAATLGVVLGTSSTGSFSSNMATVSAASGFSLVKESKKEPK